MEKVIKILKYCSDIPDIIKLNNKLMKDLEDRYYTLPGNQALDGMPKAKNNITKSTENMALNVPEGVSEIMQSLEKKNKALNKLYQEIMHEIKTLDYREQKVIFEFYILEYRWEKIARGFYSVRQCKNIRHDALKNLKMKFEKNKEIVKHQIG